MPSTIDNGRVDIKRIIGIRDGNFLYYLPADTPDIKPYFLIVYHTPKDFEPPSIFLFDGDKYLNTHGGEFQPYGYVDRLVREAISGLSK